MNRQNIDRKELRLGIAQIVGILGIMIGSILAAFFLGFYSGRSLAFEKELNNALASLPKLPVDEQEAGSDLGEKIVSEVYAKLNEQNETSANSGSGAGTQGASDKQANEFPELGSIPESKDLEPDDTKENVDLPGMKNTEKKTEDLKGLLPDKMKMEGKPEITLPGGKNEIKKNEDIKQAEHKTENLKENKNSLMASDQPKDLSAALNENKHEKELAVSEPDLKKAGKAIVTIKDEQAKEETKKAEVTDARNKLVMEEKKATAVPEAVTKKEDSAAEGQVPQITKGWYAQIAAPKEKDEAAKLVSNLKRSGFKATIENADVRGQKYYRVIVGPENSKPQADVLVKQLKRETYITGDPFIRMIK